MFTLSEAVEAERIEASVKSGVLHLFLPKAGPAQTRRSQVRASRRTGAALRHDGPRKGLGRSITRKWRVVTRETVGAPRRLPSRASPTRPGLQRAPHRSDDEGPHTGELICIKDRLAGQPEPDQAPTFWRVGRCRGAVRPSGRFCAIGSQQRE